ncbi:class I adenylate-forming enzyme family protein [Alkalilimnicola sp. S0819]|uniref:class I adenylate-forming enzyme family protein n=1 Tax=Alkalilimnicola sp. S0819 TaxID=2613922 RepID=UPI0012624BB0|nr:AMP-binding protein [Alkalilimnicola sp. S0819]KAB7624177.1 acyl-CoA synthetase [Alkalilimnicola sp. S0819]MPQ16431.1 AMP-binding protein [Alkalilimnicola sp. S0819]
MKPPLMNMSAQATLVWDGQRAVSAGALLGQARVLAEQLGKTRRARINLCEQRAHFLLGVLAALLRGETTLLPPNRAATSIAELQVRHAGAALLDDARVQQAREATDSTRWDEIPSIAGDTQAAILYTSGSTGAPQAQHKRWDRLYAGSRLLGRRLPIPAQGGRIVATVPPQHMFGLETSILLPLTAGVAVDAARPFFPQDIQSHLAAAGPGAMLMTTPLHLRACLDAGLDWPRPAFILSSTAPLSPQLATRAEQAFHAPVLEIYGSTETGALATRRPAADTRWQPLDEVRLEPRADHSIAHGPQLEGAVRLNDRIEIHADGRFTLLGRAADMLNIAGKRASLAELTQKLLAIPGVEDAALLPPEDNPRGRQRLCALLVAPDLDEAALNRALAELMDPVFRPRPLYRVPKLPRNDTGKLPRKALLELLGSLT